MQERVLSKLFLLFTLAQAGLALGPIACGNGVKCPQEAPCCSWYNQCGTGAYCLGGCNPLFSTTLESCKPQPICQARSSSFHGRNEILASDFYFGDATQTEWVSNGPLIELDGEAKLTLEKDNPGTTLFSTSYIWYGKVSAVIQSSSAVGVGAQFALLSDVQEGLGFQFVGSKPHRAEAGYFLRADNINSYKNSSYDGMTDVALNKHNYTVDWAPDFTSWYIDGNLVRTLDRASTYNSTLNKYMYPQTPARVQLTIWPAGDPANGQDAVEWAGGEVTWNDTQYNSTGYYDAGIFEVDIDCYDPPSGSRVNGTRAYIYTSTSMTNTSIEVTNDDTTIPNPSATGQTSSTSTATTTSTPTNTSAGSAAGVNQSESSSGLSTGAKAGIAIGVVLGVAAIAAVGFLLYRRSRRQQTTPVNDPAPAYNSTDYQRPYQQMQQQPQAELGGIADYRYGFTDTEPKSELASDHKHGMPVVSELAHGSSGSRTPENRNEQYSTLEAVEIHTSSPVSAQPHNALSATSSPGEPNVSDATTAASSGSPRTSKDLPSR